MVVVCVFLFLDFSCLYVLLLCSGVFSGFFVFGGGGCFVWMVKLT